MINNQQVKPGLTTKVDINLGRQCNLKCPFCYYYDSVVSNTDLATMDTEQAKRTLAKAHRLGAEEIEFTGGEPTLRKDFAELIDYCKQEIGFKLVSVISNGSVLSNKKVAQRLAQAGLDDVLISIHGHDAATHDLLTATPGSFVRLLQAVDNIQDAGLRLRTNSVICEPNYRHTTELVGLCVAKQVDSISLLGFNPIVQVRSAPQTEPLYLRHSEAAREIKRAIDTHRDQLPATNIRYMPFCFFRGYEQYVTNHDQFSWEPDEWNNYLRVALKAGSIRAAKRALFAFRNVGYKRFALRYGIRGLLTAGMQRHYARNKFKPSKCSGCAYRYVCDYVWTGYYEHYGDDELQPVDGSPIRNPVWITQAARVRRPGEHPAR